MIRLGTLLALTVAALCGGIASAAANDVPCRPAYVVPYAEQCDFGHRGLRTDASTKNVAAAYLACDRAQTVAGACIGSHTKQIHAVALSALYRDVSQQADIAMFAGQYKTAEALLREKLSVIDVVAREARPGDRSAAAERAQTRRDIADTVVGQCTERAYAASGQQRALAHARKFDDLAALLQRKYGDYMACAKLATAPQKRAYVQYVALVALEESGRASQAAGKPDAARDAFDRCSSGANAARNDASSVTKGYLATLVSLCDGRKSGRYRPDQPQPLDADTGGFRPLTLPKT